MAAKRGVTQVLLIGGRAGVGKTTVAYAVSSRLAELAVAHCHVEGDNLDAAYPKPADDPQGSGLTEANLAALWHNYRVRGYHRLIYVNTVSIIEPDLIIRAVGGSASVVSVLLTGADSIIEQRLKGREHGAALDVHLERSRRATKVLEDRSPASTHRVPTDERSPDEIAAEVVALTGWL